jgi:hypothetical protein
MKEIVKYGLVIGMLLCSAIGAASAQDELSEDYKEGLKDGFYEGASLMVQGILDYNFLMGFYSDLGGVSTTETIVVNNETVTLSDLYNQQAAMYMENERPYINGRILEIFGTDDNRTELLLLPEVQLIS